MSIKELSEFTKTSLPAASQMISRMEKDGYVIKESVKDPSLHQNRKKVLHLSEKGLDIIKKSSESRNLFFDNMKKLYSDDEYAVTEEAIQIFLEKFKQHSNGLEFILNK
jgi:DNA-binding MarR family transcriptional regulator